MRSNVPSSSGCVAGTAASGTPVVSMPGKSKTPLTVRFATCPESAGVVASRTNLMSLPTPT